MELLSEESRLVRAGRHHAHAVKVGNGRRAKKRRTANKRKRQLVMVQGVLLNGLPYGFVG